MASRQRGGDKPRKNGGVRHDEAPRASGHNSEQRAKALSEAIEAWCDLQAQEDALIELHIKPIRDKKNGVKSDVKRDYEIPTKAFNARAALRAIEKTNDDEIVLAVNELFKATPVGSNMDLFALAERVEKKRAEKAAAKNKATATEEAVA